MKLKNLFFSDGTLNALFILMLSGVSLYSILESEGLVGYLFWWSLNIFLVLIAIFVGLYIKDFWRTVAVFTFSLIVYLLISIFGQAREGFYFQFFFVIYSVFLGFASLANLGNKFICWVLSLDEGCKSV